MGGQRGLVAYTGAGRILLSKQQRMTGGTPCKACWVGCNWQGDRLAQAKKNKRAEKERCGRVEVVGRY